MSDKYNKMDLRDIVEDLIEDLREQDDGAVITTAELARHNLYDDMENTDLLELHKALLRTAKANKITLVMSDNEDKEDLPFNIPFVVHNKKAQIKCPYCGSTETARYIYGYPLFNEEMKKKIDQGKWILGGCCLDSVEIDGRTVFNMASRHCNACKKDFGTPPILITKKKDLAEDYRDIVESICFSTGGFHQGHTEITISRNENGAFVSVRQFPFFKDMPDERQITQLRWVRLVDTLYSKLYLHEWKKSYDDPYVLDGTQWSLDISLSNNRERHYHGSNEYPPYWEELKKVFRAFAKF